MAQEPQITLIDKLAIVPLLLRVLASALLRLITSPFVGGAKAGTLLKDVGFAAVRTMVSNIRTPTETWMNPTTEAAYLDFARSHGLQPKGDVLPSGLKVFWLGSPSAERVVLFFHGGGYAIPASPAHLAWLGGLQRDLAEGHDISILLVAYTLSPYEPYPAQLREAVESLEWLVQKKGVSPSKIIVAGDSAGGNMSLSLISHLLHPHEAVTSKFTLSQPLAGAVLISPWVKLVADDGSVIRNAKSDMITPSALVRWSKVFLGSKPLDNYNQALLADKAWFRDINSVVKDILIWGGGAEILLDSITTFGEKLKAAASNVELVIQPGAAHDDFVFESLFGYKEASEGTKLIKGWISERT